ncbi:MAG: Gfo/Idh/MocA family oxidoreductase, partial [Planctomycetales bacterium]|nr:Gfo/Idh/MocA family oxidoreductase [Planctomycetales bacterium]
MSHSAFRVGIIGAGAISPYHLQALGRVGNAQAVAVFDTDRQRATQLASEYRIPSVCDRLEQLLDQVNVVHILTPPATHAELTVAALMANCDVFVEKPLATSVEACDQIRDAASLAKRTVGVDHSLLADPFTLRAKRLVDGGKIGRVLSMQMQRSQDYPEYLGGALGEAVKGGDPFRDLGVHALYQCEQFLGPIVDVTARFARLGQDPLIHFDDWHATIECERGVAQLQLSWQTRPLRDVVYLFGTAGTIKLDRFGMNVTCVRSLPGPEHGQRAINTVWESTQAAVQVPWNLGRVAVGSLRRYHGLQAMVAEFYDALTHKRQPLVGVESARRVSVWLEQVANLADQEKVTQASGNQPMSLSAPTLVTGGTGFIGRHLVRRLVAEGRSIRLLCRSVPQECAGNPHI